MEQLKAKIQLPDELANAIKSMIFDAINDAKHQESETPLYMSKKQAANYLGVAPNTLDSWIKSGVGVPFKKINKIYRFNRNDLDKFMATK